MSDAVERLLVRIDATSEQLRRELKVADQAVGKADTSIGQRLQKMQQRFNDTAKVAAKFGAAAAAAGAAVTAKLVSAGLDSVDSLAKVSARLGIATEDMASLRLAAEQTGVSTQTLDMAMQRMTRRVAEAAQGMGEAQGALKELGLDAEALNELAPDQVFRAITESMEGVESQSDKVRLAMKLFDSEGVSLVQTMAAGTDGLDEFARQAEVMGLAISNIDAAKVEAANDSMNRVRKQVDGFSQQLAVKFAPILEGVADRFFGIGAEAGGMGTVATKVFNAIIKAAGFVGDSIRGLQVLYNGLKLAFLETARLIVKGYDELYKAAISLWNKLPWTDPVKVGSIFGGVMEFQKREIESTRAEIDRLLLKPLPSDAIEEWSATHTRAFDLAATNVQALDVATVQLSETTAEEAPKLASEWDQALQGTFERIDSAFSEAWKGAFDSFSDFADGLKSALKNLLGELAHLAITKPILLNIGAALGIGGASSSAMATTGIGGLFSGGGSILGSIGSFGSGLYNTIGQGASFLADLGIPGMDALSTASFGRGMTMTGGGALMNAGAGLAGGLLGNAVFGSTSGIGSTLGGIGGSIFGGPIGAAVGSFLGSGLESLIGNSQPSDKTGTALLNLSSGSYDIGGLSGKKFSQENRDAAGQFAQQFAAFAAALGGSSGSLDIGVGSRDGLRLDGRDYGSNIEGFMDAGFRKIIEGANQLDPALKNLLLSFSGAHDEMGVFAQSMVSISQAIGGNVVRDVREAWSQMSGTTVVDAYYSQIDAISDLVANFDSSADSAAQLNAALSQNQVAAAQLAGHILQLSEGLGSMFGDSAQQIRESVMTEEELFAARKAERNELRAAIQSMTDPDQIAAAAQEVNRLNTLLFQSFDNPTAGLAEQYALYAERTNEKVQNRLDTILNGIERSQEAQNARIQQMMESAAQVQQEAATTFLDAALVFAGAAQAFRGGSEAIA